MPTFSIGRAWRASAIADPFSIPSLIAPTRRREPLQFGAEIYGHAGLEADTEILRLALDCLGAAGVTGQAQVPVIVDMADARIVRSLFAGVPVDAAVIARVHAALAAKDSSTLRDLTVAFPAPAREGLLALVQLYGDVAVLDEAAKVLPDTAGVRAALSDLKQLAVRLDGARVSFDLADLRGYAYYSGMRFGIYTSGASDALVRGGRYDEVGAVFGRNRPAVGFSLDVRELVGVLPARPLRAAIRAPWSDAEGLNKTIAALRSKGETVVCVLPGHDSEIDEFHCDRELVEHGGQWRVQPI